MVWLCQVEQVANGNLVLTAHAACGKGMMCCGTGAFVMGMPGCENYATGFKGTHCAVSCTGAEIKMCTSNGECSGGKTCVTFSTKGNQVGGCQ